ncbi:putative beta-lysine N-acetyltransferase [Cohnella sp. CFH 77786]|uniref:putative beta-lysine N-acetyltransferase n=1 Tax=Cohnella sp. CFH 77786 TaxID=2662265 RepID=UPI001C60B9B5|nr:putative beta-lysine N-acetyltransferase [Cohnella sp. CFH 77786]MBW5448587.1 putative beta-lysine N-acetyltransferase [Cohnella sp. CFH 77786]
MASKPAGLTDCRETGSDYALHYCLDAVSLRLRVDDYEGNLEAICGRMIDLAREHGFTKIFIKTREEDWRMLLSRGYMLEGIYEAYFDGRDAYCMACYLDAERRTSGSWIEEDRILERVMSLSPKPEPNAPEAGCRLRKAEKEDAQTLASLYASVFGTYPTPIMDPAYVAKAVGGKAVFYVYEHEGRIVSAASAEINASCRNAEITDCATLTAYRGKGLMRLLIRALEEELTERRIRSAYSLSRAMSFGMNAALRQSGYRYSGRLTKNCDIGGQFEDMNLWVKILPSV